MRLETCLDRTSGDVAAVTKTRLGVLVIHPLSAMVSDDDRDVVVAVVEKKMVNGIDLGANS